MAITVTTAALVVILSAMNGLSSVVGDLYHAMEPDIKVSSSNSKYIGINNPLVEKLKHIPHVQGVSYSLEENALIKLDDKQAVITIKGVDSQYKTLTHFDTVVVDGTYQLEHNQQYFAIFGSGVAYRLGININDFISPISIYAPKRGKQESMDPEDAFNKLSVSPAGIFSLNDDFDFKYVLIDLKAAQQLFDCTKEITHLEIAVTDKKYIHDVQEQISKLAGDQFVVKNRYQLNDVLFKTLETEKLWTFLILAFILVIATFNIIGALTMLIIEKKNDIKTLYNLGADQQFIRSIFMREGLLITAVGAVSGLLLGVLVCWLQQTFHFVKFDEQYVIPYYPIEMQLKDFIWIVSVVMAIGFIAAIYPVRVFTKNDLVTNQ